MSADRTIPSPTDSSSHALNALPTADATTYRIVIAADAYDLHSLGK